MAATTGTFEFRLPDLGEGIHEAQVLEWRVAPGDAIKPFQALVQVESAKASVELTSPVGGRVRDTLVREGETAHLGEVLVVIDTDDAAGAEAEAVTSDADEWVGIVGAPPRMAVALATAVVTDSAPAERRVFAAPFVRKLARDLGVRLEEVPGSGPQGRVRSADVEAFAQRATATPVNGATRDDADQRVPLQGLRKRIAEHMVEAVRHAPHVTAFDQLDVTELVRLRRELAARTEADGVKLTYLPFVVKAAVEALRAVPAANAVLDEAAQEIVLRREYHVGVATAVPGGLLVPVVRHAGRRSILEIAEEVARLVAAARARQSPPEDLSGGTFTITSYGGLGGGVLYATPILNYPEVAILGIGRIEEQPRVVDGQVVPRHCMGVSFTFDHRVLDGEGAAAFLATLRRYLERPAELLLRLR